MLVHDGTIISSSFFMLEYISEALPGPSLIPADPYDAYRARAWGQYLGANLGASVPLLGAAKYLRPHLATMDADSVERRIAAIEPIERRAGWQALRDGTYSAAYLKAAADRLAAPLARVEKALQQEPWLAGPAFSVADIDAYPMLCVLPDLAAASGQCQGHAAHRRISWPYRGARFGACGAALCATRASGTSLRPGRRSFTLGMSALDWPGRVVPTPFSGSADSRSSSASNCCRPSLPICAITRPHARIEVRLRVAAARGRAA